MSKLDKISQAWLIKQFSQRLDEQEDGKLSVKRFLQLEKLYEEDGDLAKQIGKRLGEKKDLFESKREWDPKSKQSVTFWRRKKNSNI